MRTIIGTLANDPLQLLIADDPPANDTGSERIEKPCSGCGHGTLNTVRVDTADVPCCGDPWCTKMAKGGRLD